MKSLHERHSGDFATRAWQPRPPDGKTRRRWFAMGDPQAPFEKVLGILASHDLLTDSGSLREDVGLVSIGDHFDFHSLDGRSHAEVGGDGSNILRWLAEHPPDQVVVLMGNHDAGRVMELAFESDESFAAARELAAECTGKDAPAEKLRAFAAAYPHIPTPGIADRDYRSFAVHQRQLVQTLLLAGRMRLACIGRRDRAGKTLLLTHAGVTDVEVKELGVAPRAELLADALEARLRAAVARVRDAWERGESAALNLEPLHFAGKTGREGGGLLYHRASQEPPLTGRDAPVAPRRFHPLALPRGLVQVCGHTGHNKCLEELANDWRGPSALRRMHGGIRTLAVSDSSIVYDAGIAPARDDDATMYFIDIEMNRKEVTEYPLFELEHVAAATP